MILQKQKKVCMSSFVLDLSHFNLYLSMMLQYLLCFLYNPKALSHSVKSMLYKNRMQSFETNCGFTTTVFLGVPKLM